MNRNQRYKQMLKRILFSMTLLIFAATMYCSDTGEITEQIDPSTLDPTGDQDGDGLTNGDEINVYNTNPDKVDTDGDGLSDFEEIVNKSFDPTNNNYRFNPNIADLPQIDITLASAPDISIDVTYSDDSTDSYAVSNSSTYETSYSTEQVNSNSNAIEFSNSVGASVTAGVEAHVKFDDSGTVVSASATASYDYTTTSSNETSVSYGASTSRDNSIGVERLRSNEETRTVSQESAAITILVDIRNTGDVSFTLANMILVAYTADPQTGAVIAPLTNLTVVGAANSVFPAAGFPPGGAPAQVTFSGEISVDEAMQLLADNSTLIVKTGMFELLDADGVSTAFIVDDVIPSTALIEIDYDGMDVTDDNIANGPQNERYRVATVSKLGETTITAFEALTNILQVPYTLNANGHPSEVRGIVEDSSIEGYWLVIHKTSDGVSDTFTKYKDHIANLDPNNPIDLNSLVLKPDDVLSLLYVQDPDGDGLGNRMEALKRTNPLSADTDNDFINDFDEVYVTYDEHPDLVAYRQSLAPVGTTVVARKFYTSPISEDLDNDGLVDLRERAAGTNPADPNSDGDELNDGYDPDPKLNQLWAPTNMAVTTGSFLNFVSWTASTQGITSQLVFAQDSDNTGVFISELLPDPLSNTLSAGNLFDCVDPETQNLTTACWRFLGSRVATVEGTFDLNLDYTAHPNFRYVVMSQVDHTLPSIDDPSNPGVVAYAASTVTSYVPGELGEIGLEVNNISQVAPTNVTSNQVGFSWASPTINSADHGGVRILRCAGTKSTCGVPPTLTNGTPVDANDTTYNLGTLIYNYEIVANVNAVTNTWTDQGNQAYNIAAPSDFTTYTYVFYSYSAAATNYNTPIVKVVTTPPVQYSLALKLEEITAVHTTDLDNTDEIYYKIYLGDTSPFDVLAIVNGATPAVQIFELPVDRAVSVPTGSTTTFSQFNTVDSPTGDSIQNPILIDQTTSVVFWVALFERDSTSNEFLGCLPITIDSTNWNAAKDSGAQLHYVDGTNFEFYLYWSSSIQ